LNILGKLNQLHARRNASYHEDAPIVSDLSSLSYADLSSLLDGEDSVRSARARIRYMAALFPDLGLVPLAEEIHAIIDNKNVTVGDIRLILDGRSLADPSRRTHEVPLARIQMLGRLLSNGTGVTEGARQSGMSRFTAQAIDGYLGLTACFAEQAFDAAIDMVREGWSTREMAKVLNVSQSTAVRMAQRAREVLVELGEVSA
jgi:hypothetical protein